MLQRYAVADVAHRVVGVGSVGTRAYLVLCFGSGDYDPLFLQVKEAIVPVHAAYLPPFLLREQHEGRRVVGAQRLLQSLGDPLLGYTRIDGRDYFVRQMKNMKASMPVPFMVGEPFNFWAFVCGALLARSMRVPGIRSASRATAATATRWIARWWTLPRATAIRPSGITPSS